VDNYGSSPPRKPNPQVKAPAWPFRANQRHRKLDPKWKRPPIEAALLGYLAELLFQFGNQFVYALRGFNVGRVPRQRTELDDFDCELNTLVYLNQNRVLP
jgi:hypothetical protein